MSERKVATDALESLGTILDGTQKRDAIHLAVEPVTAGESNLKPGDHIEVRERIAYKTKVGEGIGIVDPFLKKGPKQGEKFWFVMYPGKVHSLRHVWTHPDFPDEVDYAPGFTKEQSEAWIRDALSRVDGPSYDRFMELIESDANDGDYLYVYGEDAHGEIPRGIWPHVENVLGKKVANQPTGFSCTC